MTFSTSRTLYTEWGVAQLLLALVFGGGLGFGAYYAQSGIIAIAAVVVAVAFLGTAHLRMAALPRGACSIRLGLFGYSAFAWSDVADLSLAAAPDGVGTFGAQYATAGTFYGINPGTTVRVQLTSGPTFFLGVSDARALLRRLHDARAAARSTTAG